MPFSRGRCSQKWMNSVNSGMSFRVDHKCQLCKWQWQWMGKQRIWQARDYQNHFSERHTQCCGNHGGHSTAASPEAAAEQHAGAANAICSGSEASGERRLCLAGVPVWGCQDDKILVYCVYHSQVANPVVLQVWQQAIKYDVRRSTSCRFPLLRRKPCTAAPLHMQQGGLLRR